MEKAYMPLKQWAEDERPREKLLKNGISSLSVNELLAVILRSGRKGESVLELSRAILSDCNNDLNKLARLQAEELVNRYKGIGIAKASALVAALELGRRRSLEEAGHSLSVSSSLDAYNYIAPILKDLDHEEFWVIYLNRSNKILGRERLSSGGITGTVIDVRMIYCNAINRKACAIIVVHNHPGDSVYPGEHDKAVTVKIKEAGKLLDIALFDHIIIAGEGYFSFLDEGIF